MDKAAPNHPPAEHNGDVQVQGVLHSLATEQKPVSVRAVVYTLISLCSVSSSRCPFKASDFLRYCCGNYFIFQSPKRKAKIIKPLELIIFHIPSSALSSLFDSVSFLI